MYWRIIFLLVVSFLLILAVHKTVDWQQLWILLVEFPKLWIIALCALSLLISVLKSWRFHLMLKNNQIDLSFVQTLKVYLAGQTTTPLPGGEALRSVLLKKETGARISETSGAVITQAFLEFSSAALLVVIGSFVLNIEKIAAGIAIGSVLLVGFLLTHPKALQKLIKLSSRIKKLEKAAVHLLNIQKDIKKNVFAKVFIQALSIAICANFLGGLMIYIIAQQYQQNVELLPTIFVYCASIVFSSLSGVIPAGLGVTEGGMVGILLIMGIGFPQALAIVVIFRLITLLFYVLVGFITLLAFYGRSLLFQGLKVRR